MRERIINPTQTPLNITLIASSAISNDSFPAPLAANRVMGLSLSSLQGGVTEDHLS
jgi:hypothetical protein